MERSAQMKIPRYVHGYVDRHGKARWYFRRAGYKKIPLKGLPWSPEFMAAYETALAGQPVEIGNKRVKPGFHARVGRLLFQLCRSDRQFRMSRLPFNEDEHAECLSKHHQSFLRGDWQDRNQVRGYVGCCASSRPRDQADGDPR